MTDDLLACSVAALMASDATILSHNIKPHYYATLLSRNIKLGEILNLMPKEIRGKLFTPNVHMDAIYIRSLFATIRPER